MVMNDQIIFARICTTYNKKMQKEIDPQLFNGITKDILVWRIIVLKITTTKVIPVLYSFK